MFVVFLVRRERQSAKEDAETASRADHRRGEYFQLSSAHVSLNGGLKRLTAPVRGVFRPNLDGLSPNLFVQRRVVCHGEACKRSIGRMP